jgi:vacuolar-type H+-ATPase subunit E/Vma4
MEEIRTSEKLEQEILEDARRKAERILKGAEKTIADIEAEWRAKEQTFLEASRRELEQRKKRLKEEISASIPLEIKRMELRILNEKFEAFLQDFFAGLSHEEFASLIQTRLHRVSPFFQGKPFSIACHGVPQVESLVRSVVPEAKILSMREGALPRGIQLKTEDGNVLYRLTVEELKEEVRQNYRREVFEALFPAAKE